MAIENPMLGVQQVNNTRRPDVGDPSAPAKYIGQALSTAVEVADEAYTAKKVGDLTADLDAERQAFVTSNQTTPDQEDVFNDIEDTPDTRDVAAFAAKYLKLDNAARSGAISETELKIRQEKILREAMNKRPWLSDDYIRAAGRSQGYNPIGTEVAAMAAAQESATANQNRMRNEYISQIRGMGVSMGLLWTDPEKFFRQGEETIAAAQELQQLTNRVQMLNAQSEISTENVEKIFTDEFLNDKGPNAFMATLPKRVSGILMAMENLPPDVASTDPTRWAQLENAKTQLITEYQVGGKQYLEMLKYTRTMAPGLKTADFDKMYTKYVSGFFGMLKEARSGADVRAAADFYLDAPWRRLLIANENLNIDLHLAKTVESLKDNAASINLSNQLTNRISARMGEIWANNGVRNTPSGPEPRVEGKIGTESDEAGNYVEAEQQRETVLKSAGTPMAAAADTTLPAQTRSNAAQLAVATVFEIAQTVENNSKIGYNRPSKKMRGDLLRTFASPEWVATMDNLPATLGRGANATEYRYKSGLRAQTYVSGLIADLGLDIRTRIAKENGDYLELLPTVAIEYSNGVLKAHKNMDVPSPNDFGTAALVKQINSYGNEIDESFAAFKNAAGSGSKASEETLATQYIGVLYSTLLM